MENNTLINLGKHVMSRVNSNTPPWFKLIRTIGIVLTATGTTVLMSPIAVPAIISTIAGYCIVGGAVATAVAQTAVESE